MSPGPNLRFAWVFIGSILLLALVSCIPEISQTQPAVTLPPTLPANNPITLHYNERPPYLVPIEQGVRGLTGDPATIVFERSNLPFRWQQTPSKRQIYILQQNKGRDCLVGWFRNDEREQFARFTLPIYQDMPQIALARADNDRIPAESTVEEIFTDPQLNLLVKDGYSYGEFLDGKIEEYNPVKTVTTVENREMLKMVFAGHADYFLIAPEEANGLIESSGFNLHDFKFIHFKDIPYGEKRYILCSMQVEQSVVDQMNAAIQQYVGQISP
jgi:polar amino acid transport system substrate-binding protein